MVLIAKNVAKSLWFLFWVSQIALGSPPGDSSQGSLWLVFHIGLNDSAYKSDGVVYRVEVGEVGKARSILASIPYQEKKWKECRADLSPYRGKKVMIRLVADPGGTTADDAASWGDLSLCGGPEGQPGHLVSNTVLRFSQIRDFTTGAVFGGKDVSPLDVSSGGVFVGGLRTVGGISRRGFFSHPCWKGDMAGSAVYAEFLIDLAQPQTEVFDPATAHAIYAKSPFSAPVNHAFPPEIAAWSDSEKGKQTEAAGNLMATLWNSYRRGESIFTIPPGDYRFTTKQKALLQMGDFKNFEIRAHGVTFWLPAGVGLSFSNCESLTLRGLSLDYETLPFSQGLIVDLNRAQSEVVVRIIDGFPSPEKYNPLAETQVIVFHPDGSLLPYRYDTVRGYEAIEGRLVRVYFSQGHILREPARTVSPVVLGDVLAIPPRGAVSLMNRGCRNLLFEDVTIFASGNFGFFEANGQGQNTYRRCRIVRRPHTKRFMACNADCFHSYLMQKGPLLENCEFSFSGDDFVNIHGFFGMVHDVESSNRVLIATPFDVNIFPGSRLGFFRFDDMSPQAAGRVRTIEEVTDPAAREAAKAMSKEKHTRGFVSAKGLWRVTLEQNITTTRYAAVSSDGARGRGFVLRSNYFHDLGGRIIANGEYGLVENNRFDRTQSLLVAPDLYWLEGPLAHHLIIRGNQFRQTQMLAGQLKPDGMLGAIAVHVIQVGGAFPPALLMNSILIESNRIEQCAGPGILLANAHDLQVRHNQIVEPVFGPWVENGKGRLGVEANFGIFLTAVSNVQVVGNRITPGANCQGKIGLGRWVDTNSVVILDNP